LVTAGCRETTDDGLDALERQRADVLTWSQELSAAVSTVLESSAEDASGAYDGVDQSGLSDRYESYRYDIQASFRTTHPDPISALEQAFAQYQPTTEANGSLHLSHGELTAVFRVPPANPGTVAFRSEGPAVKVSQDEMESWEDRVTNEPVDLN
jgi:hypothetical protein